MKKNYLISVILLIMLITPMNSFLHSTEANRSEKISIIEKTDIEKEYQNFSLNSASSFGEIWSSISGIAGEITAKPIIDSINESGKESIVYLGTTIGLSKVNIKSGFIYWFLSTPGAILSITAADDVNNDNVRDVLITFDNQQFNNTEMIDGYTGEVLWSFRPTAIAWVEGLGFSLEESRSWSGLSINDITYDNIRDIVISSFKTVYALNAINGELLWKTTGSDDIWTLELTENDLDNDDILDVIFGSQDGELVAVSGATGETIWNIIATSPVQFTDESGATFSIDQSIYDIKIVNDLTNDEKKDIMITTEEGYASFFDIQTGVLLDKVKAFSRIGSNVGFYNFGDSEFYNLIGQNVNSVSEIPHILTTGRSSGTFANNSLSLLSYIQDEIFVNWSLSSIEITNVRSIAIIQSEGFTKMIIPYATESEENNIYLIGIYNLENQSLLNEWNISSFSKLNDIKIDTGSTKDISYPFTGNYAYFVDDFYGTIDNEILTIISGHGVYLLDGESGKIIWRLTSSSQEKMDLFYDVNSDSTIDILRKSVYYLDNWRTDRFVFTKLTLIDGTTGANIWEHEIPIENQTLVGGGYAQIEIADDITGDSIPDIWLSQEETASQELLLKNISKVKLLDGANGNIVWESLPTNPSWVYNKEHLKIISICPIEDQNLDGLQDILVACQSGWIYCLSGNNGSNLWNITRDGWFLDPNHRDWIPYRPTIKNIGDFMGNSAEEFVVVGDNQILLVDSTNFSNVHWSWFNTDGWMEEEIFYIHIDESKNETYIIISRNKNEQQYTSFINLKSGLIECNIERELNQMVIDPFIADFNNDETRDHLVFIPWGDDKGFNAGYYIFSGKTGEPISYYFPSFTGFEINFYYIDQIFRTGISDFVDFLPDKNQDGIPELVVGCSIGRHNSEDISQGMVLEIIDVSKPIAEVIRRFDFIQIIKDEFSRPPLLPTITVKNLGDISGNNHEDILLTLAKIDGSFTSYIIDTESGLTWKEIDSIIISTITSEFLTGTLNESFIFIDSDGRIRALNNEYKVIVTDFALQKGNNGEYFISWSSTASNYITNIYLDGTIILTSYENQATIFMSNGNHTLSIAIVDRSGISAFATFKVINNNTGGVFFVWIVIIAVTFTYIGVKIFLWKKPKEDLMDFGPEIPELNIEGG